MNELDAIAKSIRSLSIDAIEKAKSGHPGLPLGAAEVVALLYAKILKHKKFSHARFEVCRTSRVWSLPRR